MLFLVTKLKFFPNCTKPVVLITKQAWSNPIIETPFRSLGITPLLYCKFWQIYLNMSASSRLHKKKKRKKRTIESNDTHTTKWNKRWRADTYLEMTPFIVFTCNKKRVYKRRSVTSVNTKDTYFWNFWLINSCDRGFTGLMILKRILGYAGWVG